MRIPHDDERGAAHPNGVVLTTAALVIAAILTVLATGSILRTITHADATHSGVDGGRARYAVEGCVEEALLQLRRDDAYAGGAVTVSGAACTVGVSGSGATRTITTSGTLDTYQHVVTVGVTLDPFVPTSWQEQ